MKRNAMLLAVVATGTLLLGHVGQAQDTQRDSRQDRSERMQRQTRQPQRMTRQQARQHRLEQQTNVVRADDLIGLDVENRRGEELGNVYDIVIQQPSGQVAYLVVSRGGFLGMGQEMHAISLQDVQFNRNRDAVVVDMNEDQLQRHVFDSDRWPHPSEFGQPRGQQEQWQQSRRDRDVNRPAMEDRATDRDARWGQRDDDAADARRGAQPRRDSLTQRDAWSHRLSQLQGTEVTDERDAAAGSVEDFAIDMQQGQIIYALVDVNGWARQELVAVPYQALQLDNQREAFRAQVSARSLSRAPRITDDVNLGDSRVARAIEEYWADAQVFGFPGQQDRMREQQGAAQFRGQIREVQTRDDGTIIRLRSDDGQEYQLQLSRNVQIHVHSDGRALIIADEITRDGRRITSQELQRDTQRDGRQDQQ